MTARNCSRIGRCRTMLVIIAAWLCLLPMHAASAPTLTVSQQEVTVETGRTAQLLLSTGAMPEGAYIFIDGDPGILWALRKKGASEWVLWVGPQARLTSDATLTIQLLSRKHQRLAFTQVKITPKALPSPDAVVQVALLLDGGGLVEGRKSRAYLTVTNKSEQVIALRRIDPVGADGLHVTIDPGPALIRPRETAVRPLTVEVANGRVPRTGTHLLAVSVTVTTNLEPGEARKAAASAGAPGWEARILATKEIEVTVPGLSELQGVLQIPTLLLLPGLLAMIAYTAALDVAKPRPPGENPLGRLSVALSPGVWVVMIMISAVVGIAYALLAGRNILYGFGIRDVVWLWMISLLLGGLAGGNAYRKEKARQRASGAPRFAAALEPEPFLRQLLAEKEPLRRRVRVLGEQLLFDLGPGDADNVRWACGSIVMRPIQPHDPQMFQAIRSATDDARRIAAVSTFVEQGSLVLEWKPFLLGDVEVKAPQIVSGDLFTGVLREDSVLLET